MVIKNNNNNNKYAVNAKVNRLHSLFLDYVERLLSVLPAQIFFCFRDGLWLLPGGEGNVLAKS